MELETTIVGFEGDDGSGKGTMTTVLVDELTSSGFSVLLVGPQNLPPYAKQIRDIVLGPNFKDTSVEVQAMMFTSYLLDIYDQLIFPNWGKYDFIVSDRTYLSTQVYQDASILLSLLGDQLTENMPMDTLIYLDISPGTGIDRIKARNGGLDDFEKTFTKQTLIKRQKLYVNYFNSAEVNSKYIVDANGDINTVTIKIKNIAKELIAVKTTQPTPA